MERLGDGVEQDQAVSCGIVRRLRRDEVRAPLGELRHDGQQGAGVRAELDGRVVRHVRQVLAQGQDERLERAAAVGIAAPEQHRPAVGVDVAGDVGGEPALADARLAGQQDQLPFAGGGPVPGLDHRRPLCLATHQLEGAATAEHRRRSDLDVAARRPHDAVDVDWLGDALEHHRTHRLITDARPVAGQPANEVGEQDLAGGRRSGTGAPPRRPPGRSSRPRPRRRRRRRRRSGSASRSSPPAPGPPCAAAWRRRRRRLRRPRERRP